MIKTRAHQFIERDEEGRRSRINTGLILIGAPVVKDWTPKGGVPAYVNHSRWLARCPVDGCNDVEFVDPEWPRFVCGSCGAGVYSVAFPQARLQIEALLMLRPKEDRRNWKPGESIDFLKGENSAQGVE